MTATTTANVQSMHSPSDKSVTFVESPNHNFTLFNKQMSTSITAQKYGFSSKSNHVSVIITPAQTPIKATFWNERQESESECDDDEDDVYLDVETAEFNKL